MTFANSKRLVFDESVFALSLMRKCGSFQKEKGRRRHLFICVRLHYIASIQVWGLLRLFSLRFYHSLSLDKRKKAPHFFCITASFGAKEREEANLWHNSIGYNTLIGLHSTNQWVVMPIYPTNPLQFHYQTLPSKIHKRIKQY